MATSKTLTPTNVTIQIPEFTDQPDQRVNSNCIDKEADAINALNSKITSVVSPTYTVAENVGRNYFYIKGNGRTITMNGYYEFNTAPTTSQLIITLTSLKPPIPIRAICAFSDAAYNPAKALGYLTVSDNGNIYIAPPANNTYKAVYLSCCWTYEGAI